MSITLAYYVVLLAVFAYLAKYGGRTGLWGGGLQLLGSLLSLGAVLTIRDKPLLHIVMLCIDFFSLGWKVALALISTRSWPIWVAGFQLNVAAAHISLWFSPHWHPDLFYAMTTVWAIPTLLVMVVGTQIDRRHAHKLTDHM